MDCTASGYSCIIVSVIVGAKRMARNVFGSSECDIFLNKIQDC